MRRTTATIPACPIQLSQHIPSRQDQFSQELRLASNGDRRLSYVLGLYGFHQRIIGRPISIYGPAAAYYLIGPTTGTPAVAVPDNLLDGYGQDGRTDYRVTSYAVFGEANYRIIPTVTLTGGLRYTWEDKDGFYSTTVSGGPAITGTAAQITALTNARLGVLRPQTYSAHDSDGSLSGRANLAWQVTPDVLGYASYARGFKSGGINMSGLALTSTNQPALNTAVVRPERNTTYEVGLKTRLFDRPPRVQHRRLLHPRSRLPGDDRRFSSQTVALRGYLSNIPEVTVKGVEIDATALLFRGFTVRANLAYADGRYSDYPAGPCPLEVQTAATVACSLTGRRLASLPRWTETLGADYAIAGRRRIGVRAHRHRLAIQLQRRSRACPATPTSTATT